MSENRKGEWLNIDVLAKAAGLNRSTVGRRVARFDREGLVTVRRVDGRKMIEKGAYDRACEISIDAVQSINASGRKRAKGKRPAGDPGELAKEQARRARYQGDLLELRLAELRRTLIPAAEVEEAMARAMGELVRVLNAMPNRAPEIVAACERDGGGERAMRKALKDLVYDTRKSLAASMRTLEAEGDDGEKADAGATPEFPAAKQ